MDIELKIREIQEYIVEISRKLDELLENSEMTSFAKLAEVSLTEFLQAEPDLYTADDLKVTYG